jgi:exo-1,4-beta-D-glucosaminidase
MKFSALLSLLAIIAPLCLAAAEPVAVGPVVHLRDNWTLESGCSVEANGATISSPGYRPKDSYKISVPSTVLAGQVADGKFKDPYTGMNLRSIPGTSYPIGANFSNLPMPADSPYHCPWWYRTEFPISSTDRSKTLWLHFGGINYRANIWLNGKLLADSTRVAGAYRTYDLDITALALPGQKNILAVQTLAPTESDLGINWVDWSPCPPDKDMGLWGRVDLTATGPVTLRSPMVTTHFTDSSLLHAELSVYGEIHNASNAAVHGVVSASLLGMEFEQPIDLTPGEDRTVAFTPDKCPRLLVQHPQAWWPYQMGSPRLEDLSMRFTIRGATSDEQQVKFGIREVTSELTDKGYKLFRINGKPLLIRGAGWSQDMLLRENPTRLEQQFALVRDMHLNTIRLEGKLETEDFFRLADEQGVLIMAGWCCCDQWEQWEKWTPENYSVAAASLRDQMLRIRHHASLLVWLNGSDNPPPANVEQAYLDIEKQTHWPNPILSSASATPTKVTGPSGVKMSGPYDYVAPSYWLADTSKYGGAYGFNTETSPGPAIPTIYSLRKFLPANELWPPNATWSFHNGGGEFKNLKVFSESLNATYGPVNSLDDYERVAQAMAYDGERAMFEAYGRNKYTSTGVIQWMLNNAWPSMIWHLYDYYLDAGGGYFGAKKACEPLHIQYSYDDHGVYVVSSRYDSPAKLRATVHVYDLRLKESFSREIDLTAGPDSSSKVLLIPDSAFSKDSQLYFVKLDLRNAEGEAVSQNFYWVPSAPTTFDWAKTDYTHTPALQHEAMLELRNLPVADVNAEMLPSTETGVEKVRLHNASRAIALQIALQALDEKGASIDPVFWSDNYVALMPGETRILTVKVWDHRDAMVSAIAISGWNVKPLTIKPHIDRAIASR